MQRRVTQIVPSGSPCRRWGNNTPLMQRYDSLSSPSLTAAPAHHYASWNKNAAAARSPPKRGTGPPGSEDAIETSKVLLQSMWALRPLPPKPLSPADQQRDQQMEARFHSLNSMRQEQQAQQQRLREEKKFAALNELPPALRELAVSTPLPEKQPFRMPSPFGVPPPGFDWGQFLAEKSSPSSSSSSSASSSAASSAGGGGAAAAGKEQKGAKEKKKKEAK
ncbi:hypothetical protein QOT17_024761 [Balamuthia mandrillaris]